MVQGWWLSLQGKKYDWKVSILGMFRKLASRRTHSSPDMKDVVALLHFIPWWILRLYHIYGIISSQPLMAWCLWKLYVIGEYPVKSTWFRLVRREIPFAQSPYDNWNLSWNTYFIHFIQYTFLIYIYTLLLLCVSSCKSQCNSHSSLQVFHSH